MRRGCRAAIPVVWIFNIEGTLDLLNAVTRGLRYEEWISARKQLLQREKEFTRVRDQLSQLRRDLPWEKEEKNYVFDGPDGKETLADLFGAMSQLIVYHFMFDPAWDEGCKLCSFWADNFERNAIHLQHRDVTLVSVSRAPVDKLARYRTRMGWTFKWVSSGETYFNFDYQVSCTLKELTEGRAIYNYVPGNARSDSPGISVFFKDPDGQIFHTYSCYARGLDMMNAAYHYLDLTPKGRDEAELPFPMAWVQRRDSYGA